MFLRADNSTEANFGNFYNYWLTDGTSNFDLTRGNSTGSKTLSASTPNITISLARSAMVIVDMQNFFLNPAFTTFPAGLAAVQPTIDAVRAFRSAGVKIIWCQWGLSEYDLLTMPPGLKFGFATSPKDSSTSFGSEMGVFNGTDYGRKLMRGEFNAQQYGPLFDLASEGIDSGTDFYFPKNRLSGLWGAQTPMGQYLEDNLITTLFISGVNADQCVFGTFIDAFYKGYDSILIQDATATSSPSYAFDMVLFNAKLDGFVLNSTDIVNGLGT
ncbi:Isochorismatase hydrolase [Fomitiporia mediterranea MF3/22]|uniref:Isochorismatase hydrolase n=1 Tax=Fomitiporia mediterranea (strain MF3/22) TaxID=694068 RepID=UPI0004407E1A|nr:Isochorismatase hydrolase [Fomitiporia mediterranea MF3/22]EJD07991.1 Isochorismatase hydrolase [Fomitiporia mediterranea MF3/22]